ncbi:MAG: hypothetical protein KME29_02100 [Calothrix sp. FI2-JRJ7]|jgi:hypothetical protein|nr:hypothetical protein [Calothrix sp. FI2-JRJ7]
MTILIANIGTSDLLIKIDDYYVPVGFDRSEPNIDNMSVSIIPLILLYLLKYS